MIDEDNEGSIGKRIMAKVISLAGVTGVAIILFLILLIFQCIKRKKLQMLGRRGESTSGMRTGTELGQEHFGTTARGLSNHNIPNVSIGMTEGDISQRNFLFMESKMTTEDSIEIPAYETAINFPIPKSDLGRVMMVNVTTPCGEGDTDTLEEYPPTYEEYLKSSHRNDHDSTSTNENAEFRIQELGNEDYKMNSIQ